MVGRPRLSRVICTTGNPAGLTGVWGALGAFTSLHEGGRLVVDVGGATIEYVPDGSGRSGICRIEITVDQPADPGPTRLSGIDVERTHSTRGDTPTPTAGASSVTDLTPVLRLDHVAIVVHDLDAAAQQWAELVGVPATVMAAHPISEGAFGAARITLGDQMIELLSPVEGRPSSVATRLEAQGEGPIAMAVPVADLAAATAHLESAQVRILRQPPHVLVHPRDIGGVLVQITPRVEH